MDDEVGVAPDRRGEVAVGAARQAGVAEVARVVARLLERAQDERGKRLLPAPGLRRRSRVTALADARRQARGLGRREVLGHGGRRHLEVGELGEEELDRLRVGALVDAVERLAAPAGEQLRDGLVRGDHQLLDEHVRERLLLDPRALDAALAVEGELDLPALDPEGAAREAAVAEGARDPLGEPQRLRQLVDRALVAREDRLRVAVREALAAADEAAVEARLAGLEARRRTGISTVTQRRSWCGRRLQRSSESSCGSIGATRPGT